MLHTRYIPYIIYELGHIKFKLKVSLLFINGEMSFYKPYEMGQSELGKINQGILQYSPIDRRLTL